MSHRPIVFIGGGTSCARDFLNHSQPLLNGLCSTSRPSASKSSIKIWPSPTELLLERESLPTARRLCSPRCLRSSHGSAILTMIPSDPGWWLPTTNEQRHRGRPAVD